MFVDTHCHLNDEKLSSDIQLCINKAKENGVGVFFVVGWDLESSKQALKIANEYDDVYAIVGIHPSDVKKRKENDLNEIESLLNNKKVIAVGEIGLDFYWDKQEEVKKEQIAYFIKQIEIANKHKLPISIHSRDAIEETLNVLKTHPPLYGGVMHCYSGSVEMANQFIDLGLYLSFGGTTTFKNAKTPKEVALHTPLERILLETDSPYLTPDPYRGKINEPSYLIFVAKYISSLKNVELSQLEKITNNNITKLFHVKTK